MSIDKDLLDQLMEGRSAGDLFGKDGVLAELTKALAERALSTELDAHLSEERADLPPEGQNQPPNSPAPSPKGTQPKWVQTPCITNHSPVFSPSGVVRLRFSSCASDPAAMFGLRLSVSTRSFMSTARAASISSCVRRRMKTGLPRNRTVNCVPSCTPETSTRIVDAA